MKSWADRGLPGVLPRTETVQSREAQAPQDWTFRPDDASGARLALPGSFVLQFY